MRRLTLLVLLIVPSLHAVESGSILRSFLLSMPDIEDFHSTLPPTRPALLVLSHPDFGAPLFLIGLPTAGSFKLEHPEGGTAMNLAMQSGSTSDVLGFGNVQGSGAVTFTDYSGCSPADQAVGRPVFEAEPAWSMIIENCHDTGLVGSDPDLVPSPFARPEKDDYRLRDSSAKGPPGSYVFRGNLKGIVSIAGGAEIPFDAVGRFHIHQPPSEERPRLSIVFDFPVLGSQINQPELNTPATARCYLWCNNDFTEGRTELRKDSPDQINLDESDTEDILNDLGL